MKTCTKCCENKPFSSFHRQARGFGGVKSICKVCIKEYGQKTKVASNRRSSKWKASNRDHIATYNKKYRSENSELVRLANKSWRDSNRPHKTALEGKRRANKRNATPAWLTKGQEDDIKAMYALAKKFEKLCNVEYHVDHIVPLAGKDICGLHVPWNLQLLPASINLAKGNRYNGQETLRSRS